MNKNDLEKAYEHSYYHKNEIDESMMCGCFHCLKTFFSNQIVEGIDYNNDVPQTSICPKCGFDTVIGDASGLPVTDKKFLKEMHQYWFHNY